MGFMIGTLTDGMVYKKFGGGERECFLPAELLHSQQAPECPVSAEGGQASFACSKSCMCAHESLQQLRGWQSPQSLF